MLCLEDAWPCFQGHAVYQRMFGKGTCYLSSSSCASEDSGKRQLGTEGLGLFCKDVLPVKCETQVMASSPGTEGEARTDILGSLQIPESLDVVREATWIEPK